MKLKEISNIHSGYITRGKIEVTAGGSHYLLQAKNVDGLKLSYESEGLIRFKPALSRTDRLLQKGDLLFMARGARNFTIQLKDLPVPTLAAACFFIVRLSRHGILPGYVGWYLNQAPVAQYLFQQSGQNVHMPVVRRAVLENIQIPVPALEIQTKVADLNALMLRENNLLQQLANKRRELIAATCLHAVRNN